MSLFGTAHLGLLFLVLAALAPAQGQQVRRPAAVEALPVWAGEEAAATPPLQYVFRDRGDEIVVAYPDPRAAAEGRMVTFRFWLPNRVEPHVTASVRKESGSLPAFLYTYSLRNGPGAATAIRRWSIVGPVNERDLEIEHPVWRGRMARGAAAPQALLPQTGNGAYLSWMPVDAPPLAPGEELADFRIRSTFSPGLTTAYALGEGLIEASDELPVEASQRLIPLQRAPTWRKPFVTIGPRFPPGTSLEAIVSAFRADVAGLVQEGLLSPDSPYNQELQQMFSGRSDDIKDEILKRGPVPATAFETELESALRLAVLSAQ